MYRQGVPVRLIAIRYDVNSSSISKIAIKAGLRRQCPRPNSMSLSSKSPSIYIIETLKS